MPLSLVTWTSFVIVFVVSLIVALVDFGECCVRYTETIQGLTFYHSDTQL